MPFITIEDAVYKPFDYVVIDGGTAGLTVAVRLSEDPSVTVLVLEAGTSEAVDDPNIDVPAQFGQVIGNPKYDWNFLTVKQTNSNDIQLLWTRGKVLGGSSAINFYVWSKPPAMDIDAFEKLGNPGWNWKDYHEYSKKSETVHPPAKEQADLYPHTYTGENGGKSGPIQVSMAPHFHTIDKIFQETMVQKGLKTVDDPYGGDIIGTWMAASNLDPKTWTRSYAATAYLRPNLYRPNLNVLTGALVSRILFEHKGHGEEAIATAVEVLHSGKTKTVKVGREVILSAGTIKSPQILEMSGIGQPEVVSEIGVDLVVDLPGVGENVQDHVLVSMPYELACDHATLDLLLDPAYAMKAKELHALGQGIHRNAITSVAFFPLFPTESGEIHSLVDALEAEINEKAKGDELAPGLEEQLRLQIAVLRNDTAPDCEVIVYPGLFSRRVVPESGKCYVTPVACLNHPFSRGTIHARSRDPTESPVIDPHYLENKIDLEILLQGAKFIRRMRDVEPWRSGISKEVLPGDDCISDDDLREFIKNHLGSVWHAAGSCSMLPRDKRGVVDPRLRVYGTTNVRVADISIIPLHIAAHTQATAYVIGEKVADFIKADHSKEPK